MVEEEEAAEEDVVEEALDDDKGGIWRMTGNEIYKVSPYDTPLSNRSNYT